MVNMENGLILAPAHIPAHILVEEMEQKNKKDCATALYQKMGVKIV